MGEALAVPVRPVLVSQHDLIDVAEGEFERDRPNPERSVGLPPPADAAAGTLDTLSLPPELGGLIHLLGRWSEQLSELPPQPDPTDENTPPRAPARCTTPSWAAALPRPPTACSCCPCSATPRPRPSRAPTGDLARAPWQWQAQPSPPPDPRRGRGPDQRRSDQPRPVDDTPTPP